MKNDEINNSKNQTVPVEHLLNRSPENSYIAEWTDRISHYKQKEEAEGSSVIIFRLANEWLAIGTTVFRQITPFRSIHRVPHMSGEILLGIVNFEGRFTLCVNMYRFLSINVDISKKLIEGSFERMLAIQKEQEIWMFPADEVQGIYYCDEMELENIPVTLSRSISNYLKGIIPWKGKNVGYLDDELLFYSLKRSIP